MVQRWIIASTNKKKIREIREILTQLGIELLTMDDVPDLEEPDETGSTFAENARIKARAVSEVTGLPTVADDSGLEVDALGGRPGVYSRRYSEDGTDASNNAKLLAELQGISRRSARFRCAIVWIDGEEEQLFDGTCEGAILHAPRGENGFGYDPLFAPDGMGGRTMAELTPAEKNAISHRGRALEGLKRWTRARGAATGAAPDGAGASTDG
jgi:XTP/dITP diphosphohydrolase